MNHVVSVQEWNSFQDLLHKSLNIFFFEGFLSFSHTLVKDFTSSSAMEQYEFYYFKYSVIVPILFYLHYFI